MKVHIENFQSLADAEFEAEGLTVLVGRSNLGKSAAIRAVEGALFNRAGDDFVRQGASTATVTLEQVPTATGQPLDVVWEKGGGHNKFTINGQLHAKVGTGAPVPLQEAGFKDIKIGAEELRPQATTQFDPLFLLTKPGSVVSDVLSVVSRMAVLLNADRTCTKDMKASAAMLKVRRGDLDASQTALDEMAPLVAFHARVQKLGRALEEVQRLDTATALVRAVVEKRRRLAQAVSQWRAAGGLPVRTMVPPDLGVRESAAVGQTKARRLLVAVPQALPAHTPVPEDLGVRWREGALEAVRRKRLVTARRPLPSGNLGAKVAPVVEWAAKAEAMTEQTSSQRKLLAQMASAKASARATSEESVRTAAALEQTLAEMKICPVCERPMDWVCHP